MADEIERAAEREEAEADLENLIHTVRDFAIAVAEHTKAVNWTGKGRPPIKRTLAEEKRAARFLLTLLLDREPTEAEIDSACGG